MREISCVQVSLVVITSCAEQTKGNSKLTQARMPPDLELLWGSRPLGWCRPSAGSCARPRKSEKAAANAGRGPAAAQGAAPRLNSHLRQSRAVLLEEGLRVRIGVE